jgi:hypothetical protein
MWSDDLSTILSGILEDNPRVLRHFNDGRGEVPVIVRILVKDKLGAVPATPRQTEAFLASFLSTKVDWILDFQGVSQLTDAFIEGFFLKLADSYGAEVFTRRLTWINLRHSDQLRLHQRIKDHLAQKAN